MKKYLAILMMSTALLAGCACKDPAGAPCNQETKKVMATESKSYFAFDSWSPTYLITEKIYAR